LIIFRTLEDYYTNRRLSASAGFQPHFVPLSPALWDSAQQAAVKIQHWPKTGDVIIWP
jgi:hypothetical protein